MPEYESGLSGPLFADGIYEFKCVDAGERQSKETHNTMIELQLDVFKADFTDKVRVVDRLVFVPASYGKSIPSGKRLAIKSSKERRSPSNPKIASIG